MNRRALAKVTKPLREIVRASARKLAREGSCEAFTSLEHILDGLGWDSTFAETTCDRLCAAVVALVEIAPYGDVLAAAAVAEIQLELQAKRLAKRKP